MFSYSRFLLIGAGLLTSVAAVAQKRITYDGVAMMPEAQLEVALKGSDYLLASYSMVGTSSRYYGYYDQHRFNSGQLRLGYEHFWTEQWSAGATLRYVGRYHQGNGEVLGLPGTLAPGLLLRHRGTLGAVNLGQRLGLEYVFEPLGYSGGGSNNNNRALTRLRLDADHIFKLSEQVALRPRFAYEALAYLRFQHDDMQLKERFIDFGSLRGEVGVRVSPHFDFTPWVAYQTVYRNSYPFFDTSGNQVSGGKVNYVAPVVGLDLRLTLFAGGAASEHQPLPTQH